jgi:hypothetical protein
MSDAESAELEPRYKQEGHLQSNIWSNPAAILTRSNDKTATSNCVNSKHNKHAKWTLRGGSQFIDCWDFWPVHLLLFLIVIMASTTKRADFEAIFPSLAQDILAHAKKYNLPANALEWFEKVSAPPFKIRHSAPL